MWELQNKKQVETAEFGLGRVKWYEDQMRFVFDGMQSILYMLAVQSRVCKQTKNTFYSEFEILFFERGNRKKKKQIYIKLSNAAAVHKNRTFIIMLKQ